MLSDLASIFQWWVTIFLIGIIFTPITNWIFPNFFDKGYVFAKIIGIALISYVVFVLGFLKLLPFTETTIALTIIAFLILNIILISKYPNILISLKKSWKIFFFEEILFIGILILWSFIHVHQPDIHGLEKYMDYGFINSILRTKYLPPKDMWLTPFYINYYYFGHLITALLTKISFLTSAITFNLMLSTISALSFVSAFSIGANLLNSKRKMENGKWKIIFGGFITGLILNFAGNLHTVYLFFKPYQNENPIPLSQLIFSPQTFPNSYWYPNATRFIHNTIHEFPLYSYVVSDLHGHVLDIPFVLLTIAILLSLIQNSKNKIQNYNVKLRGNNVALGNSKFKIFNFRFPLFTFNFSLLTLLAFMLAVMYMTNAWDGIIYFLMTALVILYVIFKPKIYPVFKKIKNEKLKMKNSFQIENLKFKIRSWIIYLIALGTGFFIFSLPFNLNFKPFASGIGILCAPKFLTGIGNFGPLIFETDHCQHSPLWQLFILYGFFYLWVVSFFVFLFRKMVVIQNSKNKIQNYNVKLRGNNVALRNSKFKIFNFRFPLFTFNFSLLTKSDIFVGILILLSTLLIVIPEFVYVKDIYPAHYRANTMFKLVYQSFIMLSLASAYIFVRLILNIKNQISNIFNFRSVFLIFAFLFLILVLLYPYFAINSYFGNLKEYFGLNGTNYLRALYSGDYEAISWINKNIKGQPIILEAQGDSYTDYGRVSANTGLPTVLGWTVHEWLWRGTYDIPSPRIPEVTKMYESQDLEETKNLLEKYNVSLVFVGDLEHQKYSLNEEKFKTLGKVIYKNEGTKIYQLNHKTSD